MKRPLLSAAALALSAALPAQALDITAMSEAERDAFRAEIRDYLMDNPEVIFEAVAVLEERQADAQAQDDVELVADNADALFHDEASWVGGNAQGDVTVVEFLDYRCGYCRKAFDEVNELLEEDGNIRFIVKEFPILGEQSMLAARFAIATLQVAGDAAYESVHDALMSFTGEINETALTRLAGTLEIDAQPILDHMDSDAVSQVIAANHALGQRMGINGTPSFVMGDQMVRGYVPLEGMRQIVEEVRAE